MRLIDGKTHMPHKFDEDGLCINCRESIWSSSRQYCYVVPVITEGGNSDEEVSQPNEQMIETIEKSLDNAERQGRTLMYHEWLRALLEENKRLQRYVDTTNYNSEKIAMDHTRLEIALQQTREELKLSSQAHDHAERDLNRTHTQLEQVKAELERSRGSHMFQYGLSLELEIKRLKEELEQRTGERNEAAAHAIGYKSICDELRTELSAKDKAIKEIKGILWDMETHPVTREARINSLIESILSQYRGDTHE